MFNFTIVVFDGTSPTFYFTNTSGWNTSSYFNKLGSCGVSELSGNLMTVASDVGSAVLPDLLIVKSLFNRILIVAYNYCGL